MNRFIGLDKLIEDYIQEQQNRITWAKSQRDVDTLLANSPKQKEETTKVEEIQISFSKNTNIQLALMRTKSLTKQGNVWKLEENNLKKQGKRRKENQRQLKH